MNETELPPYPLGGTPEVIREWVKIYMQLFPTPQEFVRERTPEWINEETGEYEKNKCREDGRYKFFLRFVKKWFTPCEQCQQKLYDLIYNAPNFYLGNKSYEPAIELSRSWEIDDDSWVQLEKREATEADFRRIYGHNWKSHYEGWKEAFNK